MIAELIAVLTEKEKGTLRTRVKNNTTRLYEFIGALLDDPNVSQQAMEKRFGITSNTYFKNISLAKDEIYEVIKHEMKNAYDDMLLPNVLYRRGLEVHASRLRLKLEEEYETQGWWNILQEFYNMEMIVAYAKCDIEWLEKLKDKAISNMERFYRFVKVDREVIFLMAVIEKGDLKAKEYSTYAQKLHNLLQEAYAVDHPIPVFNALHSLFVFYTRYDIELEKAKTIIQDIHGSIYKYGERMIPYARNAAWLNTMGFHADFATGESPEQYLEQAEQGLHQHGLLFDSQVVMNICTYYFLKRDSGQFGKRFDEFQKLPVDRSFDYKAAYLRCLYAYLLNNRDDFFRYKNDFYSEEKSRAYNDYDLTLRYLEMLFLLKEKKYTLVDDKLAATIKFARRNFTHSRVDIEKQNWNLIKEVIYKKPIEKKGQVIFRMTDFMREEIGKLS